MCVSMSDSKIIMPGDPEFVGNITIQHYPGVNLDEKKVIGWSFYEKIGIGILNPRGLTGFRVRKRKYIICA